MKSKVIRYLKKGIELEEYQRIKEKKYDGGLRIIKPSNDLELEIVSEYIFGVPLHLKKLDTHDGEYASYEVLENHDDYYDQSFNIKAHNSSYEVDDFFWKTVIGSLFCGGIARASYGQVDVKGYRNQRRIVNWVFSRRNKSANYIRKPFTRLAELLRVRREQNYSR